MNTHTQKTRRALFLALALGAVAVLQLRSQNAVPKTPPLAGNAAGDYLLLTFTTVKPDRVAEYERLQKEEFNPALKKAGVTARFVSTRATAGEGHVYVAGRTFRKFAELEEENRLTKSLGQAGAQALLEKLRACQSSTRNLIVRTIPDLSWGLEAPMPMYVVTTLHLVNGKKAEWLKYQREDLVPALRKSGLATYLTQETLYGGDTGVVYTLTRLNGYADLDTNKLRQHLGEDAYTKLMAKRPTGAVATLERTLGRHRTDLSIVPEPTTKPAR